MVLQKRIDYGFNGYQVPPTPRATRSARRRRTFWSKGDDNRMCSFDLLATVAGKLLLEGDNSNSSADTSNGIKDSIKTEHFNEPDPKSIGHGICDQGFFVSELVLQAPVLNKCSHEPLVAQHNACSGPASAITSSASCKLEGDDNKKEIKSETFNNGKVSFRNIAEHNSVKFPLCGDHIPCGSISVNNEDVKLGNRDDDENSGCTQPSTGNKSFRPIPYNGYQRNQKDDEQCIANYVCHSSKNGFKRRQMSLRDYPLKKRRLYYSSLSNPNDGEGICSSPRKCSYSNVLAPVGTLQGVTGPSATSVERASVQPRDSRVKLKIKSFRVPELFIEISETATVGSLKRTVMEAVTAILGGGGLHVGVLLQGKKIRDDNKTLLQTGISSNNKPDALGFILEPNSSSQATPILCSEALPFLLPCDTPEPLKRCPAGPSLVRAAVQHESSDILPDPPANTFNNFIESDHDSAPSPPDTSHEQHAVDSRALVVVPSMNPEALSVVPMRKPKKSESAQRRIRRPFSVSEVEALVQAVEKLGTGRWRDVKLRAFDTAKHRTYVDLKDKWKTLVHTARISPQQRRGEPVPQELLDRVLMAHAYWSQQQAKQQLKQHSEACLLL